MVSLLPPQSRLRIKYKSVSDLPRVMAEHDLTLLLILLRLKSPLMLQLLLFDLGLKLAVTIPVLVAVVKNTKPAVAL